MSRTLVSLVIALVAAVAAAAEPPRVIHTAPAHGDLAVDPALSELRITFDQDMGQGRSLCGGGESFPEITGDLRWVSARTLIVPVKLAADHSYALSINCASFRNFQSVAGESAEIYPLQFRTRGAGEPAPVRLTAEENRAAITELARLIDEVYSHRDRLGVEWPARFNAFRQRLESATIPAEFARAAAELLAPAEDLHLGLAVGQGPGAIRFGTHRRIVTPNVRLQLVEAALPGLAWRSPSVAVARTEDGFGYIQITTWAAPQEHYEPAMRAVEEFAGAPGIVIDVRLNAGGDELAARSFAARFVHDAAVYSRSRYRDPGAPDGFTPPIDRVVEPAPDAVAYGGPVAVLMGPANMSSCESFLLMMKQAPRATLIGEPSYGSSGNPRPFELGNGVTAIIPTWIDLTPQGAWIEGAGLKPDITARYPADATVDPVLAAALAFLRSEEDKTASDRGQ